VLRTMDDQRVDVLVYPTVRRKPAVIGEGQNGSTCALSANTGFPAITMPAGFTADGLPVGLEALGRPMSDDRLVAMAFGVERMLDARRAPYSTPPLVGGRAPAPSTLRVVAEGPGGERAVGRFTFDVTRSTLDYQVELSGRDLSGLQMVTLNPVGTDGNAPVLYPILLNGARKSTGSITLSFAARQALLAGELAMVFYTQKDRAGGIRAMLVQK
jgi:amidase